MEFPLSLLKLKTPLAPTQIGAENVTKKTLTFYHSIQPVYIISRIFGLLPFTVLYNSNGYMHKAKVRLLDLIWFVFMIIVNFGLTYKMVTKVQRMIDGDTSILFASGRLIILLNFVKVAVASILDMLNRNRLVKMLKDFLKFDKSVRKNGKPSIADKIQNYFFFRSNHTEFALISLKAGVLLLYASL